MAWQNIGWDNLGVGYQIFLIGWQFFWGWGIFFGRVTRQYILRGGVVTEFLGAECNILP